MIIKSVSTRLLRRAPGQCGAAWCGLTPAGIRTALNRGHGSPLTCVSRNPAKCTHGRARASVLEPRRQRAPSSFAAPPFLGKAPSRQKPPAHAHIGDGQFPCVSPPKWPEPLAPTQVRVERGSHVIERAGLRGSDTWLREQRPSPQPGHRLPHRPRLRARSCAPRIL